MTHDEICNEIKKLEDWQEYYEKLYIKTKREIYFEKSKEFEDRVSELRVKIGTAPLSNFLNEALNKGKLQVSQAVKDKFKAIKETVNEGVEITEENLTRALDNIKNHSKSINVDTQRKALSQMMSKALKKNRMAPLETGQLKRSITGKKDD